MNTRRPIFRAEALERYRQGLETAVLPGFSRPSHIVCLWALIVICFLCGMAAGWARIAIYAPGYLVAGEIQGKPSEGPSAPQVVLVPARYLPQLQVGQAISLQHPAGTKTIIGLIAEIEPHLIGPGTAGVRFGLSNCVLPEPSESLALAVVKPMPGAPDWPAGDEAGNWRRAEIEIGTRRLGAFLPGIGSWYERW